MFLLLVSRLSIDELDVRSPLSTVQILILPIGEFNIESYLIFRIWAVVSSNNLSRPILLAISFLIVIDKYESPPHDPVFVNRLNIFRSCRDILMTVRNKLKISVALHLLMETLEDLDSQTPFLSVRQYYPTAIFLLSRLICYQRFSLKLGIFESRKLGVRQR